MARNTHGHAARAAWVSAQVNNNSIRVEVALKCLVHLLRDRGHPNVEGNDHNVEVLRQAK